MCTIEEMSTVDECTKEMYEFHGHVHSKRRRDAIQTLNPTVRGSEKDMRHICKLMGESLKCMGPKVYKNCRKHHPHLAEMDAVYGYPCGPKEKLFFHHYDCIQRSHLNSFRLALCEDQTNRALTYISKGVESLDEKRRQKCQAMSWMMECERPVIYSRCSMEAAQVYVFSLMSSVEYVAPECYPNYKRRVFEIKTKYWKSALERVDGLAEKEVLACTSEHQQSITSHFTPLYRELLRMQDQASSAFPIAFAFSKRQLENRCDEFKTAMQNIPPAAKRNCIRRFEMYNMVYFGLGYPCGYGTRDYFDRYFDCLVGVKRKSPEVRRCEELANHRLNDASLDVCETFDVMADCMYDTVVQTCGYDGWEIEYQYLSMNLRNKHECRLRRIFRSIDAPQTQRTAA